VPLLEPTWERRSRDRLANSAGASTSRRLWYLLIAVSSNGKIIFIRSPVNFVWKRDEQSSSLQELVKSETRSKEKKWLLFYPTHFGRFRQGVIYFERLKIISWVSVDDRSSISQASVKCRSSVGQVSVRCRSSIDDRSLYRSTYLFVDYRSIVGRLSVDGWPIASRQSTDRLVDRRPIVGRYIGRHIDWDHL